MPRPRQPVTAQPRRPPPPPNGRGGRIVLFETEREGAYHEHWFASSALDAARRAFAHAGECSLMLDRVEVSSMVQPEDSHKGGLVYVLNDARTYVIERGRVRRADLPDEPRARQRCEQP